MIDRKKPVRVEAPSPDPSGGERVIRWYKRQLPLALKAMLARRRGVNWRNPPVQVGACALGVRHSPRNWDQFVECDGANFKPKEGKCGPRCCAEDECEQELKRAGCFEMVGMVIFSPFKVDDFSGLSWRKVNPPCGYCRRRFKESIEAGGIVKAHTQLVCINADTFDSVETTVAELLAEIPQLSDEHWTGK